MRCYYGWENGKQYKKSDRWDSNRGWRTLPTGITAHHGCMPTNPSPGEKWKVSDCKQRTTFGTDLSRPMFARFGTPNRRQWCNNNLFVFGVDYYFFNSLDAGSQAQPKSMKIRAERSEFRCRNAPHLQCCARWPIMATNCLCPTHTQARFASTNASSVQIAPLLVDVTLSHPPCVSVGGMHAKRPIAVSSTENNACANFEIPQTRAKNTSQKQLAAIAVSIWLDNRNSCKKWLDRFSVLSQQGP